MAESEIDELKEKAFELRLDNWRRWCNSKGFHRAHVFSLEGRYRSPQHWHPEEPKPAPIDPLDAVTFNRAYTRLTLIAPNHANVIKILVFFPFLPAETAAKRLAINHLEMNDVFARAKRMLANQLEFIERL